MSPKIKQALSLLVSTTVVLAQPSVPTYATGVENSLEESTHSVQQEAEDNISLEEEIEDNISSEEEAEDNISSEEEAEDNISSEEEAEDNVSLEEEAEDNISSEEEAEDNISLEEEIEDNISSEEEAEDSVSLEEETEDNISSEEEIEDIIPYAAAVNPKVVYTQATKSNSDRSGNGSKTNPYNRFEDAVANVEDGGTIIIKTGRSGFVNAYDEDGKFPFVIDKDITIRSESNDVKAVLHVRTGGIILDADVTFENIEFAFANKLHDSIFANGHTLKIIDCVRGSGSRQVDLFAGSLYDTKTGEPVVGIKYDENANPIEVVPTPGNHGRIIIETSKGSPVSEFGKVFAGSMNGNFKGNADIEIIDNGNLDLVSIHSCGAEETPPGPMFDLTEPAPPQEKPNQYTVDGTVNISLTNYKKDINGAGAKEVHATLSHDYAVEYFKVDDVNSLTIKNGTFIPDAIKWKNGIAGDLTLSESKSHLNLSKINTLDVNNFNSNGMITLQRDGKLNIHNDIIGQTLFQTVRGAVDNSFSGLVDLDHPYITSLAGKGDSNSFIFKPHILAQSHYSLERHENEKQENEWIVKSTDSAPSVLPDKITSFEFDAPQYELKFDPNKTHFIDMPFTIDPDFDLGTAVVDNGLNIEVFINGKQAIKAPSDSEQATEDIVPIIWHADGIRLSIELMQYQNLFAVYPTLGDTQIDVPLGPYEVTICIPDYNISATTQLNVTPKDMSDWTTSSVDLDIKGSNNQDITEVNFGEDIEISASIAPSNASVTPFALRNYVDFIVNGQLVASHEVDNNLANLSIPVTTENGFKSGVNKIKVVYGGSKNQLSTSIEKELTVNKIAPKLELSDDVIVRYDGKPHGLNVIDKEKFEVEPTVYYYTDSQYTQGETTRMPINAGIYYVKAVLPESDISDAAQAFGMVEIKKATPNMMISGTILNMDDQTNDLVINLDMSFALNGVAPTGEIKLECVDASQQTYTHTEELKYGSVTYVFEDIAEGTATITATYIPHINEVNYNQAQPITETFQVISNFVPVEKFELVASELQFYVHSNGTVYQNNPDIILPFTISPDDASIQDIIWESSDTDVVTVNYTTGKLEIHSEGEVIITAKTKDGSFMHSCQVNIVELTDDIIPVQSVSLDTSSVELNLDTQVTHKLTALLNPIDATYPDIIWKSKDDRVATVDDEGNVTAIALGETQIMAVTKDGAKIATCTVKVKSEKPGNGETEEPEKPGNGDSNTNKPSSGGSNNNSSDDNDDEDNTSNASGSSSSGGGSTNKPNTENNTENSKPSVPSEEPSAPGVTVSQFKDLTHHWAKDDIQFVLEKGLFKGLSTTHFGANATTDRGMFVTVLHRLAGSPQADGTKFSDVNKETYYADAVAWATSLDIVSGVSETQFAPTQELTREQLVVMLYRYAKVTGMNVDTNLDTLSQFKDTSKVSAWSQDAMNWAISTGIIQGTSDRVLGAKNVATRAQVATILKRFILLSESDLVNQ